MNELREYIQKYTGLPEALESEVVRRIAFSEELREALFGCRCRISTSAIRMKAKQIIKHYK